MGTSGRIFSVGDRVRSAWDGFGPLRGPVDYYAGVVVDTKPSHLVIDWGGDRVSSVNHNDLCWFDVRVISVIDQIAALDDGEIDYS